MSSHRQTWESFPGLSTTSASGPTNLAMVQVIYLRTTWEISSKLYLATTAGLHVIIGHCKLPDAAYEPRNAVFRANPAITHSAVPSDAAGIVPHPAGSRHCSIPLS